MINCTSIFVIKVGGISTGKDALDKIEAGASAVQIYTSMVRKIMTTQNIVMMSQIYEGPGITRRIKRQLSSLMYSKGTDITDVLSSDNTNNST